MNSLVRIYFFVDIIWLGLTFCAIYSKHLSCLFALGKETCSFGYEGVSEAGNGLVKHIPSKLLRTCPTNSC